MRNHCKPIAWAVLVSMLSGCGSLVSWNYYAPFRLMGEERALSPVDPAEIHHYGVTSRLHYVALTVDGVFFRNLPHTKGREVALGVELNGALEKRDIKTVSEPVAAQGEHGHVFFDRPFSVDPFLYRGVPLQVTLNFRDVGPSESTVLKGRLTTLGLGLARKLIPGAPEKLNAHQSHFEAFLGGDKKGQVYKYTFQLYPSDTEGVRPDLVLVGGRHVFVAIPSESSPPFVKKLKPVDIAYKLRLEGNRLVWRHDGKEYTDSPYVLLSIIRYKRYPAEDTPLRKAVASVEKFIDQQNWQMARSNLGNVGAAIVEEKSITQLERNLEVAWKDVREAAITSGEAAAKSDKEAQLAATLAQVKHLGHIGKDFQQILEPAEVKDILFRAKRLGRQAEELAKDLNKPAEDVAKVIGPAIASIAPPTEPPPPPPGLKPPEVVKIVVAKPEPFYTRWWFYALVGVAAAGLLSGSIYAGTRTENPPADIFFNYGGKPR